MQSKGFASINDTRLYYEIAGRGEPLVLIHGFSLDSRMWEPQWESFAQKFRVLRYDMRGFGQSAHPNGALYTHAEDLNALMDYLGLESAIVVGCSMGGGVAIDFALSFPERVRALIPYDSVIGGFVFSPEFSEPNKALYSTAKEVGVEAAKELWSHNPMFKLTLQRPQAASIFKQMLGGYSGLHWLGQDSTRRYNPLAIQRIGEIAVPTLVLVGEGDVPDMQAMADTLARQISGAQMKVLPDAGHLGNLENPEGFNHIILGWLSDLS